MRSQFSLTMIGTTPTGIYPLIARAPVSGTVAVGQSLNLVVTSPACPVRLPGRASPLDSRLLFTLTEPSSARCASRVQEEKGVRNRFEAWKQEKGTGYFSSGVRGRDVVSEWKSQ
jgi:hypothetical protein